MAGAPLKDDLELDASILLGQFLETTLAAELRHNGYHDLESLGGACGASAAQVTRWIWWQETPPPHQARKFLAEVYARQRNQQLRNHYRAAADNPPDPNVERGLSWEALRP